MDVSLAAHQLAAASENICEAAKAIELDLVQSLAAVSSANFHEIAWATIHGHSLWSRLWLRSVYVGGQGRFMRRITAGKRGSLRRASKP